MTAHDQAYKAGRNARERGKGEFEGPRYGMGEAEAVLRDRWRKGWRDKDAEMKKK